MSINDIREIYRKNSNNNMRTLIANQFLPTNIEKLENAEVSTPVFLIDEMLSKIPEAFWKSPKAVFEPCCGKGNFLLGIFDKFYEGLEESISDTTERCKTIVAECIFFGDISEMNVLITTEILRCHIEMYTGIYPNYTFNIFVGNTLILDVKEHFKIEHFDSVIGNPPYNKSRIGEVKGKYGGRSLWDNFVVNALTMLKESGYLLYIHPPSWRKPNHYLWKIMSSKQIHYLKSYSKQEGLDIFGCSVLTDYYLLENTKLYKNTEFVGDKTYSVNLSELPFLPSGCIEEIRKILGSNKVIHSSSIYDARRKYVSPTKKEDFILPVVHSMTKKKGLGFIYSKDDRGHFRVPKVILSFGQHQYPHNDWEGKYGMSQMCFGLEISSKEEGDNIVKAINSDKFREILKNTKWSTFQTDWRMFQEFKKDFWKEFI